MVGSALAATAPIDLSLCDSRLATLIVVGPVGRWGGANIRCVVRDTSGMAPAAISDEYAIDPYCLRG